MPDRMVNLALLWLVLAAFLTGWASFALGTPPGRWVVVLHGLLGLAPLGLLRPKLGIVRRGLRRPRPGRAASVALSVSTLVTLASGLALTTGLPRLGPVTTTQAHVGAGVVTLGLILAHARRRPARPAAPDPVRRRLLRSATLAAAAGLLWTGWEATGAATRRFTGSHEQGTDQLSAMPVTQWLDDRVPRLREERPTLLVGGREVSVAALPSDERVRAVLDCTGGWYAEQVWNGTRLDRLVSPPTGARSVVVRSVTGYSRRFPLRDLGGLWLVTGAGDRPLDAGHGAPVRLVAPGRRGFWWVKWVASVEPSALPWWLQSPFPLT